MSDDTPDHLLEGSAFMANLAERLMQVPVCYGVGQHDIEKLDRLARNGITVEKQSLLNVVRKLDFNAPMSGDTFAQSFDNLRLAFTQDELAQPTVEPPKPYTGLVTKP